MKKHRKRKEKGKRRREKGREWEHERKVAEKVAIRKGEEKKDSK
jgi:hypothetical protein